MTAVVGTPGVGPGTFALFFTGVPQGRVADRRYRVPREEWW